MKILKFFYVKKSRTSSTRVYFFQSKVESVPLWTNTLLSISNGSLKIVSTLYNIWVEMLDCFPVLKKCKLINNIYCVQVVVGRVDLSSVVLNKVKTQNVQLSSGENISADLVFRNIFNWSLFYKPFKND